MIIIYGLIGIPHNLDLSRSPYINSTESCVLRSPSRWNYIPLTAKVLHKLKKVKGTQTQRKRLVEKASRMFSTSSVGPFFFLDTRSPLEHSSISLKLRADLLICFIDGRRTRNTLLVQANSSFVRLFVYLFVCKLVVGVLFFPFWFALYRWRRNNRKVPN